MPADIKKHVLTLPVKWSKKTPSKNTTNTQKTTGKLICKCKCECKCKHRLFS